MSVIEELIRSEENGAISFGNHRLEKKAKLDNFEHQGDLYKVKTFHEITKLERNGMFVYESSFRWRATRMYRLRFSWRTMPSTA